MADGAIVNVGDTVKVIVPVKIGEEMKDVPVGAVVLSLGPPCVTVQLPPGPYSNAD